MTYMHCWQQWGFRLLFSIQTLYYSKIEFLSPKVVNCRIKTTAYKRAANNLLFNRCYTFSFFSDIVPGRGLSIAVRACSVTI